MRILLNMNLTPMWCEVLARAGNWVVITQDLDFGSLLALRGDNLPSVIQIRTHATLPSDIEKPLLDAIDAASAYLETGALVTLTPSDFRVTVLPIRPTSFN
jgi:predicted nuclease of predicted toxin-antitoxin system